jgi:hypothetical protein
MLLRSLEHAPLEVRVPDDLKAPVFFTRIIVDTASAVAVREPAHGTCFPCHWASSMIRAKNWFAITVWHQMTSEISLLFTYDIAITSERLPPGNTYGTAASHHRTLGLLGALQIRGLLSLSFCFRPCRSVFLTENSSNSL